MPVLDQLEENIMTGRRSLGTINFTSCNILKSWWCNSNTIPSDTRQIGHLGESGRSSLYHDCNCAWVPSWNSARYLTMFQVLSPLKVAKTLLYVRKLGCFQLLYCCTCRNKKQSLFQPNDMFAILLLVMTLVKRQTQITVFFYYLCTSYTQLDAF